MKEYCREVTNWIALEVPDGSFMAPAGTIFEARALPPGAGASRFMFMR